MLLFVVCCHIYTCNFYSQDITAAWNADKKSIMKEALRAKFEQNVVLRRKLLNTANRLIIEVSQDDTYWSQLADGSGSKSIIRINTHWSSV